MNTLKIPWLRESLLSLLGENKPMPSRQTLQIINVDSRSNQFLVSDKRNYIPALLTRAALDDFGRRHPHYTLAQLQGAVIQPLVFAFVQSPDFSKFFMRLDRFKLLGSEGCNTFGAPFSVSGDIEVERVLQSLKHIALPGEMGGEGGGSSSAAAAAAAAAGGEEGDSAPIAPVAELSIPSAQVERLAREVPGWAVREVPASPPADVEEEEEEEEDSQVSPPVPVLATQQMSNLMEIPDSPPMSPSQDKASVSVEIQPFTHVPEDESSSDEGESSSKSMPVEAPMSLWGGAQMSLSLSQRDTGDVSEDDEEDDNALPDMPMTQAPFSMHFGDLSEGEDDGVVEGEASQGEEEEEEEDDEMQYADAPSESPAYADAETQDVSSHVQPNPSDSTSSFSPVLPAAQFSIKSSSSGSLNVATDSPAQFVPATPSSQEAEDGDETMDGEPASVQPAPSHVSDSMSGSPPVAPQPRPQKRPSPQQSSSQEPPKKKKKKKKRAQAKPAESGAVIAKAAAAAVDHASRVTFQAFGQQYPLMLSYLARTRLPKVQMFSWLSKLPMPAPRE